MVRTASVEVGAFRVNSCRARPSELISNSMLADASKNTCFKGRLETVSPSESTELQRKRRSRERFWELATFKGSEVGLRILQIQRVLSGHNRHREPFARGWWRREGVSNRRYGRSSNAAFTLVAPCSPRGRFREQSEIRSGYKLEILVWFHGGPERNALTKYFQ